jgi:hypothetical protein
MYLFENQAVFNIVNLCLQNKVRQQIFSPSYVVVGSWIQYPRSGMVKNQDPRWLKIRIRDKFFCLLLFEGTFTSFSKDKKSKRCHTTVGFNVFLSFLLKDRSLTVTNGSGFGRSKHIWILRIRIQIRMRIRNTVFTIIHPVQSYVYSSFTIIKATLK